MNWMKIELLTAWVCVAWNCIAIICYFVGVFFRRDRWSAWATRSTIIAFLFHSGALGLRWFMTGHGPYTTTYEVYASNGWAIIALLLVTGWRIPSLRMMGAVAVPANLFFLLLALAKYERIAGIPTAFNYLWLVVHILFVKLSVGAILIALGCSIFFLRKRNEAAREDTLQLYNYRFTGIGFVFWSLATGAGAVWGNLQWGRYWAWDPIETWSLVVWLGLGLNLHLQRFYSWTGRKAAYLTVATVSLFIATLFVVPFVSSSIHTMYVLGGKSSGK